MGDIQGSETALYDTILMATCHFIYVQFIDCTSPGMNSNVNYGLWVVMM